MGLEDVLIVIPARYASTRFPGKVIYPILGRPMVWWVWRSALDTGVPADNVVIATDSEEVRKVCEGFGARVKMTSPDCPSGSDRVAEVARDRKGRFVVNLQADEPALDPGMLRGFMGFLLEERPTMASVYTDLQGDPTDPNVVKVVLASDGTALYFSRSPIPYDRAEKGVNYYQHIGIYGYDRQFLLSFVKWPPGILESIEKLEQLRALERGVKIKMFYTRERSWGVDVPDDVETVERILGERHA